MKHHAAFFSLSLLILSLLLAACGDSSHGPTTADPALRPLLLRTLQRAAEDSLMLAVGTFEARVLMTFELRQSDDHVRIEDRMLLKKDTAAGYIAEQQAHGVEGDTSLLKNMYSFEDAQGNARGAERAHLASLDFGTSFPLLLHELLSDSVESTGFAREGTDSAIGTHQCSVIAYATPQKSGRFWIDNRTFELVRLEVRQQSNYVVGSYNYRAVIDFNHPDGELLLPVKTEAQFDYRRVFASGTGTIIVMLDSVVIDKHLNQAD